jgi:hypothetical protein
MNPLQFNLPLWTVTNPILLWLFRHGWEDPEWGRTPVGQVALATAIYDMAGQIGEVEVRRQIQGGAAKAMSMAAERMAAEQ